METDELLELTVDEQKDELENLDLDQLKELREAENRNTAIDNIDVELNNRDDWTKTVTEESDKLSTEELKEAAEHAKSEIENEGNSTAFTDEEIEELAAKLDYILEKSKTVSQEGFKEYEN